MNQDVASVLHQGITNPVSLHPSSIECTKMWVNMSTMTRNGRTTTDSSKQQEANKMLAYYQSLSGRANNFIHLHNDKLVQKIVDPTASDQAKQRAVKQFFTYLQTQVPGMKPLLHQDLSQTIIKGRFNADHPRNIQQTPQRTQRFCISTAVYQRFTRIGQGLDTIRHVK